MVNGYCFLVQYWGVDFLAHMFMAKPSSKSHALLLLLVLVLLSLVLPSSLSKNTSPSHNYFPTRKESSSMSYSSHMMMRRLNDKRETTDLHNSPSSKKKTRDFFRAAAHEVPSGPNPESNRWLVTRSSVRILNFCNS